MSYFFSFLKPIFITQNSVENIWSIFFSNIQIFIFGQIQLICEEIFQILNKISAFQNNEQSIFNLNNT